MQHFRKSTSRACVLSYIGSMMHSCTRNLPCFSAFGILLSFRTDFSSTSSTLVWIRSTWHVFFIFNVSFVHVCLFSRVILNVCCSGTLKFSYELCCLQRVVFQIFAHLQECSQSNRTFQLTDQNHDVRHGLLSGSFRSLVPLIAMDLGFLCSVTAV